MSRVFFLDYSINSKKNLILSLSTIKGLGYKRAMFICKKLGFQKNVTFSDLENTDIDLLKNHIEQNFEISSKLDRKVTSDILKLFDSGSYRGKRHKMGYPVRGQRTLSNGKTQRYLSRRRFGKVIENYEATTKVSGSFFNSQLNSYKKSFKKKGVLKKRKYFHKKKYI